ncbi:MAG: hypothetical protein GWM90_20435, partial [Gemmatimonadetes bacterium]|nr:hypothetical protein [Gemmatimonadota bacterium]NIQ56847.1 hypothetical protein [Gemmatimonadota bacterium]NIU77029.1 hypothetical protein [Gammaproteobacteria bacterium]NIX46366.1 hypothetical protein [Gemmatimonadota bacterium]NIY10688.1 hypothetical protein [Gemmatimonadota bacterium]
MTSASVERATAAAVEWLRGEDVPEAAIVAHEAGLAEDDESARRWIRRLLDDQDDAGAWGGDLLATTRALDTLRELRAAASIREQAPGIGRALDWVRARRGVPGAWTDGCSEERHHRGLCHHFAGGFFSPGPPEVPLEEAWLHPGVGVSGDAEVRFVASAAALRCLLGWEKTTGDARLHLTGLRRVVLQWSEAPMVRLSGTALMEAVHALLHSPVDEDRAAADQGLQTVAGRQRGDGSWVDLDPFHALEVFGRAA